MRRDGKRQYEIAAAMGVSRQRVHQILTRVPTGPPPRPDTWLEDVRTDLNAIIQLASRGRLDGVVSIASARLALLDQRFGGGDDE
jgi:hypothetical protein